MPPGPLQLLEGKEENSLVTSPFSTFEAGSRKREFLMWREEREGGHGGAGWGISEESLVGEGKTGRETANCFWMEFSRQGLREQMCLLNFHS